MDHTAAQATFVEISFGVNTLFAVYENLRVRLHSSLSQKVGDFVARAQVIEAPQNKEDRIKNIEIDLTDHADRHLNFQCDVEKCVTCASVIAAALGVLILHFDWLDAWGHWLALLFLPFPFYLLVWALNYPIFVYRGNRKLNRFSKLRDEFESPPRLPFG
jgi:hypothetical protein